MNEQDNADHREAISLLRRTIGSGAWLDGLSDDDWHIVWTEIVPILLDHAEQRGVPKAASGLA